MNRIGLAAFFVAASAQAADTASALSGVALAIARSRDLSSSLTQAENADPEDRKTIATYYTGVKRSYLVNPLAQWRADSAPVIKNYVADVAQITQSFSSQLPGSAQTSFKLCMENNEVSELARAESRYLGSIDGALQGLGAPFNSRFDGSTQREWSPEDRSRADMASRSLDKDWGSVGAACCQAAAGRSVDRIADEDVANAKSDKLNLICSDLKKKLDSSKETFQSQFKSPVLSVPPDPLSVSGFSPPELATLLESYSFSSRLRNARASGESEDDLFANAEQECRTKVQQMQTQSRPVKKEMLFKLGESLKCAILPSLGTAYGNLLVQRLSTTLGRVPAAGDDWNLSCDPQTMNALDMSRPGDPLTVATQWGVPQMADPPYIKSMRALPPLSPPFSISQLPGGGVLTPFGGVGIDKTVSSLTGTGTSSSVSTGASGLSSTGRGLVSGSSRRVATSRGLSSAGTGRGLVQGAGLARGTRQLASQISRGDSPARAATVLKSGASSTRRLVSQMATNNGKLSSGDRRRALASEASNVKGTVRALSSARASRTTTDNILNSLRGRNSVVSTSSAPPSGGIGSLDNIRRQNDQERARIERMAQSFVDNISLALQRGESTRLNMQKVIAQRDGAVAAIMGDLPNASPKQQAKKVQALRRELMDYDKQIALLKTEYDTLQSSILEQGALLQNLQVFGPKGAKYPYTGGAGKLPPSFPTRSGALDSQGLWPQFLDTISMIQNAWAAASAGSGVWNTEQEWTREWTLFLNDYEKYATLRKNEEKQAAVGAANQVRVRSQSIQFETLKDSDSDTLVTAQMYAQSILDETDAIVKAQGHGVLGAVTLDAQALTSLKQARDEAEGALGALQTLALQYQESYPKNADENPEAWWSVLPELFFN